MGRNERFDSEGKKIPSERLRVNRGYADFAKTMGIDISLRPQIRVGFRKLSKQKQEEYRKLQKAEEKFLAEWNRNDGNAPSHWPTDRQSRTLLALREKADKEIYEPMKTIEGEMKSLQTVKELEKELQKHEALLDRLQKDLEKRDRKLKKLEAHPVEEKTLAEQVNFDFDDMVKRAKTVDLIPMLPEQYRLSTYILPYRLTKHDLIEDTQIKTGRLLRHERVYQMGKRKTMTVTWTTFVPSDEPREGIPTYGEIAKNAYIAPHAFAIAQNNPKRVFFRPVDVMRHSGYPEERIAGKTLNSMTNIYRTMGYTTIEIVERDGNKVTRRELGKLFDKILIDEKNGIICLQFTQDDEQLKERYLAHELKPGCGIQFVGVSTKQLLLAIPLDHYDKNFDRWAIAKRGLRKRHYPIRIDTLAKKAFIFPPSFAHKKSIYKEVTLRLDQAKGRSIGDYELLEPDQAESVKRKIQIDFALERSVLEKIEDTGAKGRARGIAKEMARHCCEHFQTLRKTPEELEEQFYNTIIVRDLDSCKDVFQHFTREHFGVDGKIDRGAHPGDLFTDLKELSKIRRKP